MVFTSVARGNVAGAITGATISNVVGIVLTPLLVGVLMVRTSGQAGGNLAGILLQLLLPFAAGQLVQRWLGPWLRARPHLTRVTDRSVIVLVAYTSVSQATVSGAWSHVTWVALVILVVVCAAMLATMLLLTWTGGGRLGLARGDRVALLMCGSKKSLATGLPMAAVLFAPALAASVALPVIVFHQLQLATCAVLAQAARRPGRVASARNDSTRSPRGLPVPDVIAVIPQPAVVEPTGDAPFVLTEATTVVVDGRPDLIGIAVLAADLLGRVGGRAVEVRYAESSRRRAASCGSGSSSRCRPATRRTA